MLKRYNLSAIVKNHAGVLSRISGLFSRRGYNITSLTVGETEDPAFSRVTIEVDGDEYVLEQIKNQLNKLIDVVQTKELKSDNAVLRELVLVKVSCDDVSRPAVIEVANIFRAKVVDISTESIIMELTGGKDKINAFLEMMGKYGIRELARTGVTALGRGSGALKNESI